MILVIIILAPILTLFYLAIFINLLFKKNYLQEVYISFQGVYKNYMSLFSLYFIISFISILLFIASLVILFNPAYNSPDFTSLVLSAKILMVLSLISLLKSFLLLVVGEKSFEFFDKLTQNQKKIVNYISIFFSFLLYAYFAVLTYIVFTVVLNLS